MKKQERAYAYAGYRKAMVEAGVSAAKVDKVIAEATRDDEVLDRLECPKCGGVIARNEDKRSGGASRCRGTWYNYRCACGHAVDRKES